MHQVFLGLGSNLGDRHHLIEQAVVLIEERIGYVVCQSSLVESTSWGYESDHIFLNGVLCCETEYSPHQVLEKAQEIERALGKKKEHATKRGVRTEYNDRPIDIDILLYDDLVIDEPDLKIPHPLMEQREFVMKPLTEVKNMLSQADNKVL